MLKEETNLNEMNFEVIYNHGIRFVQKEVYIYIFLV